MTGELFIAVVLLAAPGFPIASALIGVRAESVFLAPLIGALMAGLAAALTLGVAGDPLTWYAVIASLASVTAIGVSVRRGLRGRLSEHGIDNRACMLTGAATTVIMATACAVPLGAMLQHTSVGWDARSFWLLHSRWLIAGHAYAAHALVDPSYEFAHGDYPPTMSGAVAVAWQATGHVDLRLAQLVIGALNACVFALVGCGVAACAQGRLKPLGLLAGAAVAAAAVGSGGPFTTDGYADALAAGAGAAAVVYGLILPASRHHLIVAGLVALVAGTTKNEGLMMSSVVVALVAYRYGAANGPAGRRAARTALLAAVLLVPLLVWPVAVRLGGVRGSMLEHSRFGLLLHGDPIVISRVAPTLNAIAHQVVLLPVILVATIACWLITRRASDRPAVATPVLAWIAIAGYLVVLALVYIATDPPVDLGFSTAGAPMLLENWLMFSVDRVTTVARVAVYAMAAIWLVAGVDAVRGSRQLAPAAGLHDDPQGKRSPALVTRTATRP